VNEIMKEKTRVIVEIMNKVVQRIPVERKNCMCGL
jgi:hypothetical protein